jgi:hypothetical protein
VAVLSPPYALGAAGQVLSGKLLRHALGCTWRPSTAALGGVSAVVQGPAGSQMELTLVNATTLRVNPGVAVIQGTQSADQGQYEVVNDAQVTFTLTGQHASQYRRSLVVVQVNDSQAAGVASSATTDRAQLVVIDGALSATAPGALPPLPANSVALGEVAIPPTGQTVTLTPYNPRTTTRGGMLYVLSDTSTVPGHGGEPGAYVGQSRIIGDGRREWWNGSAWAWGREALGIIDYREYGASATLSNAASGLPAFDMTVTFPSRRRVRQTIVGSLSIDTLGTVYGLLMTRNGAPLARANVSPPMVQTGLTFQRSHVQTIDGGTYTFAITGGRLAGGGIATLTAAPDFDGPWQHTIEDLGAG